jgi:hypothetical protein
LDLGGGGGGGDAEDAIVAGLGEDRGGRWGEAVTRARWVLGRAVGVAAVLAGSVLLRPFLLLSLLLLPFV